MGDNSRHDRSLDIRVHAVKPKQNDAAVDQAASKHKLAEVLIAGNENGVSFASDLQHYLVRSSAVVMGNRVYVVYGSEPIDDLSIHPLVGDEYRLRTHFVDHVVLEHTCRVLKRRAYLLHRDVRVFRDNLVHAFARRDLLEDGLHGDSCPANNGFAAHHRGIGNDVAVRFLTRLSIPP